MGIYKGIHKTVLTLLLFSWCAKAAAQDSRAAWLRTAIQNINAQADSFPGEKLYVQTDKPAYNPGDTIWFKCYLFNAADLSASSMSGILYVEVANENGQVIRRRIVPLKDGIGWGDLALLPDQYPPGSYTLRAYTNWMRNFDESRIFQRRFWIRDFSGDNWLIHSRFRVFPNGNGQSVAANLRLDQLNGQQLPFRDVEVALVSGEKVLHKNNLQTNVNGDLSFNFEIPEKAGLNQLNLRVTDLRKGNSTPVLTVPVIPDAEQNTDLQFLPEGGTLVAGIDNLVGFKAVGVDGRGVDVSGSVYDRRHEQVAAFQSSHLGMGSFHFIPRAGEVYAAVINTRNGHSKPYPLPVVKSSGVLLHIRDPFGGDSIEVNIIASPELQDAPGYYYLVAQDAGTGCFGALFALDHGTKTFHISRNEFPEGVAVFTLLDPGKHPLCQRSVFIDHADGLNLQLIYNSRYAARDSVGMDIRVLDASGKPVQGSFSLAVTDDVQVPIDTAARNSLVSYLLLTSNLTGWIEDPGYYFREGAGQNTWDDLDNLLLTQGWVSYNWDKAALKHETMKYAPESSFSVSGKVTNVLNKPVDHSNVILFATKPLTSMEGVTGRSGEFAFDKLFPLDSTGYLIQARNKHGKSFNVGVELNEFTPPVFQPLKPGVIPWYVNIDTGNLSNIRTGVANQEEINRLLGRHVLKGVVIKGKKTVLDSKNLNGPGGADLTLSQTDMQNAGKATLKNVLYAKVPGFGVGGKQLNVYAVNNMILHLIIDGVNVDFFRPEGETPREFYDSYLDYLTAEDIKGIEVMKAPKYTGFYVQKFLDPREDPFKDAFIEITTYSGNGAMLKKTPGVYFYRPAAAFGIPAQFYSPKYRISADTSGIDNRSTIFWAPEIVTDSRGEARVSFYTAGKAGTYTLILEGSDMNGHIGSIIRKITVK